MHVQKKSHRGNFKGEPRNETNVVWMCFLLITDAFCHIAETPLLSKLKDTLKFLQDFETKSEVSQEAIHLVTKELHEQAQEMAMKIPTDSFPAQSAKQPVSAPKEKGEPLFCKDTVHHASLCCRLVSDPKIDAGNYQSFFKKKEVIPGHSFQKVSLSREKQDRYLIAQQGDSILYFTFQSEPSLQKWKRQFKSFSEGM